MASFTITNYTESTATIRVTGLTAGDGVYVVCRLYSDTSDSTYTESFTASSSVLNIIIRGLSPSTYYIVNVRHNPGGTGSNMTWLGGQTFTTDDPAPVIRIETWSWLTSNGSATVTQTIAAYSALTGQGLLSDFSYLVWNDMCAKVLEVIETLGYSWSTAGSGRAYSETIMSTSDKAMTAERFNSLKYNVGRLYSTGIADVNPGDIMYGSYFVDLMAKVNSWINSVT